MHIFFNGSLVEAIYSKCFPILPNQLVYPEHIPSVFHASHFYPTNNFFFPKIKKFDFGFSKINQANNYQNFVAIYDCSILAAIYDNRLEKLCQK